MIRSNKMGLKCLLAAGVMLLLLATGAVPLEAADSPVKILFIGDSLTAGLGVMPDQAYPARIQQLLDRSGRAATVINAGISGSTSAGAAGRLKWHLRAGPDILVLALGANDGLRGLSTRQMYQNLSAAIALARQSHIRVLLCGMEVPPNYGPGYSSDFRQVFFDLADEFDVTLVPFLLAGVGGHPELNQADGIHPTADGHTIIARTVYAKLLELL